MTEDSRIPSPDLSNDHSGGNTDESPVETVFKFSEVKKQLEKIQAIILTKGTQPWSDAGYPMAVFIDLYAKGIVAERNPDYFLIPTNLFGRDPNPISIPFYLFGWGAMNDHVALDGNLMAISIDASKVNTGLYERRTHRNLATIFGEVAQVQSIPAMRVDGVPVDVLGEFNVIPFCFDENGQINYPLVCNAYLFFTKSQETEQNSSGVVLTPSTDIKLGSIPVTVRVKTNSQIPSAFAPCRKPASNRNASLKPHGKGPRRKS